MCGIFGFSLGRSLSLTETSSVKKDIKNFVELSIKRGTDAFGININYDENNYIYKSNSNPKIAIKRKEYNKFIDEKLKLASSQKPFFNYFGQTRLVTNGSKFFYKNNQPVSLKRITGLHNGIIHFDDEKELDNSKKNYESFQMKSDTVSFFEKLEKKTKESNESIIKFFMEFIEEIDGTFSIAFMDLKEQILLISSNTGSLYYFHDIEKKIFVYASEKKILKNFIEDSNFFDNHKKEIKKIINKSIALNYVTHEVELFDNFNFNKKINISINENKSYDIITNEQEDLKRLNSLKKCSKCILPETYPFIEFDKEGVCNYCNSYQKQKYLGEDKLEEILSKYRKDNNTPDCLVGLSGGRDSSYGLHILKKKYKMNPVAFSYDWGGGTATSRLNANILAGKLGVELIVRSADIEAKRRYVRQNIFAWLKDPHLGMLPIVQAGDKGFMDLGRTLLKDLNLDFSVQATGYQIEQREFFVGFTGIKQNLKNNQRLSSYTLATKLKLFLWYSYRTLKNPAYINGALLDNFNGYLSSFIKKENSLHLYKYIEWNEKEIEDTLKNEYGWISDKSYGKNQWRMGDAQTSFNNFIYYHMAGFSEFDNFRSNQIREGLIDRSEALRLCEEDNKIKFDTLKNFSEIIGFNLDDVLSKISCLPRLY